MVEPDSTGSEIFELRRHIRLLEPWLTADQRAEVRQLQLTLDGTAGQPTTTRGVRDELTREVTWRAAEVDGCQRAMELVPAGGTQNNDDSMRRIARKMERRASEIADLQDEIARLREVERRRNFDFEVAERHLLLGLRRIRREAEVAKRHARVARYRMWATPDAVAIEADEMWSPTPVYGYRIWGIRKGRLYGAWTPWRTNHFIAECVEEGAVPHTDGRCAKVAFGCGVYAAKSVKALLSATGVSLQTRAVVGLVSMAGRVVEHDRGYRAQEATVVAAAVLGLGNKDQAEVRLFPEESDVEDLFVDIQETLSVNTPDIFLAASGRELIEEVGKFMSRETRRRSEWT